MLISNKLHSFRNFYEQNSYTFPPTTYSHYPTQEIEISFLNSDNKGQILQQPDFVPPDLFSSD